LHNILYLVNVFIDVATIPSIAAADKNSRSWKLKHGVIEAINELIEDIDNCHSQIAEQALEHIHQKYGHYSIIVYIFYGQIKQTSVSYKNLATAFLSLCNLRLDVHIIITSVHFLHMYLIF
jgi:hypothetical protein